MSTPQNIQAQVEALELDGRPVVIIARLERGEMLPEQYAEKAQGVMRALSHSVRQALGDAAPGELTTAAPVPPILVTDETVAIQLEPDHHHLLRDLAEQVKRARAGAGPAITVELQERLLEVFPEPQVEDLRESMPDDPILGKGGLADRVPLEEEDGTESIT